MHRKPRDPKKSIFADGIGATILRQGFLVGAVTLISFWISGDHISGGGIETGRTMAFATLGLVQLFLAWGIRSNDCLHQVGFFSNPWMWRAFLASAALLFAVLLLEPLQKIFSLTHLNCDQWLWVIGLSLVPLILLEIKKFVISCRVNTED